jgi:DNA-binding MarR family transcriptional regulator
LIKAIVLYRINTYQHNFEDKTISYSQNIRKEGKICNFWNFGELRKRLELSEGSLHSHFRYLEKDKLVTYRKEFRNRRATTIYSITEKGMMNLLN